MQNLHTAEHQDGILYYDVTATIELNVKNETDEGMPMDAI